MENVGGLEKKPEDTYEKAIQLKEQLEKDYRSS